MRAASYVRRGPAGSVLTVGELPDPQPGPGEVRIKMSVPDGKPQVVRGGSYRW